MRSSSDSSQATGVFSQAFFPILIFAFSVGLALAMGRWGFSGVELLLLVLGPIFFFVCFFFIKTGLILLVFSMLFSPEIMIGSIGFRPIAIRIEDLMIPILVLAWVARLSIQREFRLLQHSPLNIPILSLLAVSFYSTVHGLALGGTSLFPALFYNLKTIEFFAIFFLVLNYIRTERQISLFLSCVLLTLCVVGIYTLTQVPSVEIFTERRVTAPFEGAPEPSTIGGYMAFLLPILFSLSLYEKKPLRRWFYGLLGVMVLIPFIYTLSRTSYVALLGGLIFFALMERRKKWLSFLLVAFLLVSPFVVPKAVKERIAFTWEDSVNPGRTMGVDASFQWRISTYDKLWNYLRPNLIFGCGIASTDNSDSQYARTLFELGLSGFFIWAWIFVRLFRISRWLFHSLEEGMMKGLVLGYRAGLVVILLHGFGAITFYIVRIMEPFWFITGLVVSLYSIKIQQAREEQALAESLETNVTE